MTKATENRMRVQLQAQGFDGLCDPQEECGCGWDDFAPCSGACAWCLPAHRVVDADGVARFYAGHCEACPFCQAGNPHTDE